MKELGLKPKPVEEINLNKIPLLLIEKMNVIKNTSWAETGPVSLNALVLLSLLGQLEEIGLPFQLVRDQEGRNRVQGTKEAVLVFEKIIASPEYQAIFDACRADENLPKTENCDWPDQIKIRLDALYWEQRVTNLHRQLQQRNPKKIYQESEEELRGRIRTVSDKANRFQVKPLTFEEIFKLTESLALREIASTPELHIRVESHPTL